MQVSGNTFQAKQTTGAKVLRLGHAWHVDKHQKVHLGWGRGREWEVEGDNIGEAVGGQHVQGSVGPSKKFTFNFSRIGR